MTRDMAEDKAKAKGKDKAEDMAKRIMPVPRPLRWVVGPPATANPTRNGRLAKSIG